VHPGLVGPYRAVAARLPDVSTAGPVTFVHGDLHDRNVLLGDHGGGIIDLDGVGVGDPAIDVGNLAAHVLLRALQRGDSIAVGRAEAAIVLAEHPHGGPRARSWGAHTLFRLSVLYRFRMRWAHLAPGFLAEASAWATDDAGERVG
jgi:aminoglycoside phosphotransferase (APT) family kinase protein